MKVYTYLGNQEPEKERMILEKQKGKS